VKQERLEQCDRWECVLRRVETHMFHSHLTAVVPMPQLHQPTLLMGSLMLSNLGWSDEDIEGVLCSLLLIYHGLAVHDEVELTPSNREEVRQLSVLAGDFFSSKYYRLLAEMGQYALIQAFAKAIQTINESKARLRSTSVGFSISDDEYIALQEQIGLALLYELGEAVDCRTAVSNHVLRQFGRTITIYNEFEKSQQHYWDFTYMNLLLWRVATPDERRILGSYSFGDPCDNRLRSLHTKYQISAQLRDLVSRSLKEFIDVCASVPDRAAQTALERFASSLANHIQFQRGLVEER